MPRSGITGVRLPATVSPLRGFTSLLPPTVGSAALYPRLLKLSCYAAARPAISAPGSNGIASLDRSISDRKNEAIVECIFAVEYLLSLMDTKPAISFHAKVRVRSANPATREIDGRLGYVAGITERPMDDGHFGYGVFIYEFSRVWCCAEAELEPTGERDEQSVRNAEEQRTRHLAKGIAIVEYVRIAGDEPLPKIGHLKPYKAVVVIEEAVSPERQKEISKWLVDTGCLYMMAWGLECSNWDDSVDVANLENFNYQEVPENDLVMTTWHENEVLEEVFWFSKNNANHPTKTLRNTVIIHLGCTDRSTELKHAYGTA
jgi:hypothetical protein